MIWGGERLFAAGADIKEMADFGPDEIRPVVAALGDAIDALEAMPKISIAAVTGYALGGGLELALGADLRYLAEDATIGQPEIKIGVIPGAGGTQRLTRLLGPARTRRLVYTGAQLDAARALELGLADRVLPASEVLDVAIAHAREFARGPREALAAAKAAIRAAVETPGPAGMARERELFVELFGSRGSAGGDASLPGDAASRPSGARDREGPAGDRRGRARAGALLHRARPDAAGVAGVHAPTGLLRRGRRQVPGRDRGSVSSSSWWRRRARTWSGWPTRRPRTPSRFSDERALELSGVVVRSDFRGRGVGRALVAEAARFAQERGIPWVELKTFSPNQGAMEFWESLGFTPRVVQMTSSSAALARRLADA